MKNSLQQMGPELTAEDFTFRHVLFLRPLKAKSLLSHCTV